MLPYNIFSRQTVLRTDDITSFYLSLRTPTVGRGRRSAGRQDTPVT